jgi:hydroxymethylbilane synthase
VHSLKDLMTEQPEGLKLGAVGHRASRHELLLVHPEAYKDGGVLPFRDNAVVGTGSARRKSQIWHHRPDAQIKDLRGNVPTRVNKLREKQYDAIILAAAGVERLELDLDDLKVCRLDPLEFLPAPAQGILGIQIRANDPQVEAAVSILNSAHDAGEASLERGLLAKFESGCSLPLGVYSEYSDKGCRLAAVLGVREDNRWVSLRRTDIRGDDVAGVVAAAYLALTENRQECA